MLRLTNLADYAIVLMCQIARTQDRINVQGLSQSTGIPQATVAKILNTLGRAELLVSHRGLKGGYSLLVDAAQISMADIIEAIDGPIALTNCADTGHRDCSYMALCCMKPHWQMISDNVRASLHQIKLASLLKDRIAQPLVFSAAEKQKG